MLQPAEESKIRKNITITPSLWKTLRQVGKIQGKSASSLIEESIKLYFQTEHINKAYLKMMGAPEVDDIEQEEISKALDSLDETDLEPGATLDV